jgi:hypothetical protein
MPSNIPAAAAKVKQAAIGLRKVREKNRIAKKHLPAFREFFQQQRDEVLLRFVGMKSHFAQETPAKTNKAAPKATQAALDQFNDIWSGIEKATTGDLQDLVVAAEMDGMQAGGDLMAKTINPTGKFWDLSNPRAVAFFQKTGGSIGYIKDIQDTTAGSLRTVITTALDEGWSYNDTAREIQKLYDGPISTDRAKRIAVTESARAYEAGNRAFADTIVDDGIEMEKRWRTSGDEKVCDICLANEADGWIPIDEPHSSGDQYPPAHPGEDRCYEEYRQANGGGE